MRLCIIADDLTGAADTGVQFAKRDFHTILLPFGMENTEPSCHLREAQVVALNTDTRGMQAGQAYDAVKNATTLLIQTFHPQNIYKKIDSTLRGNVGIEIEAVMDATGNKLAILAPAFPDCNRTTVAGIHLVNGQPLSQTEVSFDPISPVHESYIPTLICAQTRLKVGHISLEEVRRGSGSLRRSILQHTEDGEKIIVFDAVTNDDLNTIVGTGMSIPSPPLMVGSAGLANQLSRFLNPLNPSERRPIIYERNSEGVVIIISGSLSAVTSRQLDRVRKNREGRIIPVDAHRLVKQENEIVSEIISATEVSKVVGIQSVMSQNVGARHAVPLHIVECLGKITLQVVKYCPQKIRGLILSGGDTALAVFKYLGISYVQLIDEILPGIPCGQVLDRGFADLTIVTKAGALGDENALVECVDFLLASSNQNINTETQRTRGEIDDNADKTIDRNKRW